MRPLISLHLTILPLPLDIGSISRSLLSLSISALSLSISQPPAQTHLRGSPPLHSLCYSSLSRPWNVDPSSSTRRPHHHHQQRRAPSSLPLLPPHAELIPFTDLGFIWLLLPTALSVAANAPSIFILRSVAVNIILNHDFSGGLQSWHPNGCHGYVASGECGHLEGVTANSGGSYAVVSNRTECWQGLEQDITSKVSPDSTYRVSATVRVSGAFQGSTGVQATLKLEYPNETTSYLFVGRTMASHDQWEKLEGTFLLERMPNRVVFYLEGPSPGADLLIDYVIVSCSSVKESEELKRLESQPLEEGTRPMTEDQRFKAMLGPKRSGYIRGRGAGPKPKTSTVGQRIHAQLEK